MFNKKCVFFFLVWILDVTAAKKKCHDTRLKALTDLFNQLESCDKDFAARMWKYYWSDEDGFPSANSAGRKELEQKLAELKNSNNQKAYESLIEQILICF